MLASCFVRALNVRTQRKLRLCTRSGSFRAPSYVQICSFDKRLSLLACCSVTCCTNMARACCFRA